MIPTWIIFVLVFIAPLIFFKWLLRSHLTRLAYNGEFERIRRWQRGRWIFTFILAVGMVMSSWNENRGMAELGVLFALMSLVGIVYPEFLGLGKWYAELYRVRQEIRKEGVKLVSDAEGAATDMAGMAAEAKRRWVAYDIAPRPGASEEDIRQFQERYRVRLPEDLEEYFRTVDGMDEYEYDEDQFRFWPIAEVQPVAEHSPEDYGTAYDGYFLFADYSIWCFGYAVRLSSKSVDVAIVNGDAPRQIASSFTDFLQRSSGRPNI